jgi:Na+/H+ antiporter NhaC
VTESNNGPTAASRLLEGARKCLKPSLVFLLLALLAGILVGLYVSPTWTVEEIALVRDEQDRLYYKDETDKPWYVDQFVPMDEAQLRAERIEALNAEGRSPEVKEESVSDTRDVDGKPEKLYFRLVAKRHWRFWSLLPAVVAVGLCWMLREPVTSLLGGIIVGAMMLGHYDVTEAVLVKNFATENAAGVLLLYLWLLGGLLGIWSRTGAAQAFADLMTRKFVRGPKTAKLVAWSLGVIFFQGGTVSTVLVGTTVKPVADKERVSHEELAYIVDSTASPIASQLAFNAWPGYIQAFIFVAGVSWLATEADRTTFFYMSVPFCFYAIFAVTFTFLLSIEKSPFLGSGMRAALKRARETGQLDHPDAEPLAAKELHGSRVPEGYTPNVLEFFIPLFALIGIAVGTFIVKGSPQVRWAFGAAVMLAATMALLRGMPLRTLIEGVGDGLKGVVLGSVILLLAITIGNISKEAGGGIYLVELLGDHVPYWALPVMFQLMTIVIAFSTGTSWGTYAVAFPLAMPLAYAVAKANGMDDPHTMFYMTICFATVMDGSVFGDQCSPISDTTVLSSMCTGCDLMDHVRTQIPQASVAALLAAICWTTLAYVCPHLGWIPFQGFVN